MSAPRSRARTPLRAVSGSTTEAQLADAAATFLANPTKGLDWSATPEGELLSGEARQILEEGLALLPEHYRAILVLRDVEELSNEEVAEVLGESVASVKSRLHRARMALREVLTRRLAGRTDT